MPRLPGPLVDVGVRWADQRDIGVPFGGRYPLQDWAERLFLPPQRSPAGVCTTLIDFHRKTVLLPVLSANGFPLNWMRSRFPEVTFIYLVKE
jgi:hypothetical protein